MYIDLLKNYGNLFFLKRLLIFIYKEKDNVFFNG